jgi:hypothetical protein
MTGKRDRTQDGISRQLKAMSCPVYDIGVRDATSKKMICVTYPQNTLLQSVKWMKFMNLDNHDIYIRPNTNVDHGLVMVDDVTYDAMDSMKADGFSPALVIETSPKNYQAWVKLGEDVAEELRTIIARRLSNDYDADPASADGRHFGRLAGFTNRKPEHMKRDGYFPWVLCRDSNGGSAPRGNILVRDARLEMEKRNNETKILNSVGTVSRIMDNPKREITNEYLCKMQKFLMYYNDLSICDWHVVIELSLEGWGMDDIIMAMIASSPDISKRKADVQYYANLTVSKVMDLPYVREARASLLASQKQLKVLDIIPDIPPNRLEGVKVMMYGHPEGSPCEKGQNAEASPIVFSDKINEIMDKEVRAEAFYWSRMEDQD